jgi:hypothetical protein
LEENQSNILDVNVLKNYWSGTEKRDGCFGYAKNQMLKISCSQGSCHIDRDSDVTSG